MPLRRSDSPTLPRVEDAPQNSGAAQAKALAAALGVPNSVPAMAALGRFLRGAGVRLDEAVAPEVLSRLHVLRGVLDDVAQLRAAIPEAWGHAGRIGLDRGVELAGLLASLAASESRIDRGLIAVGEDGLYAVASVRTAQTERHLQVRLLRHTPQGAGVSLMLSLPCALCGVMRTVATGAVEIHGPSIARALALGVHCGVCIATSRWDETAPAAEENSPGLWLIAPTAARRTARHAELVLGA